MIWEIIKSLETLIGLDQQRFTQSASEKYKIYQRGLIFMIAMQQ